MSVKRITTLGVAAFLIFVGANSLFSQDQAADTNAAPVIETQNAVIEGGAVPETKEPETQWIYGDVINLDPQNKTILVKTLDYETDQEKEINIATDEKTTFENIKSMDEIKPNDTVSVDYSITADGKNLAKNISLEKPEAQQAPKAEGQPQMQAAPTAETPETVAAPEITQGQQTQGSDNSKAGY